MSLPILGSGIIGNYPAKKKIDSFAKLYFLHYLIDTPTAKNTILRC
jgi:hypothetical protein